jgi:hypothetical protein
MLKVAKVQQKSKIILYLGYNDMVKKTISRYCPSACARENIPKEPKNENLKE